MCVPERGDPIADLINRTPMKPISVLRFALALSAAVLAGGCSTYEVKVDSISRESLPTGTHSSYTIQNRNPAIATDSLRYKEAAQRIKTALSGHGLWEAADPSAADMIVELDYDIEPAKVVYKEVDVDVFVPKVPVLGLLGGRELVGVEKGAVPTIVREKHLSKTNPPRKAGRLRNSGGSASASRMNAAISANACPSSPPR